MGFHSDIHHRHSIRLPQFDYSNAGAYFVTICFSERECLLSSIENKTARLSEIGHIVQTAWDELPQRFTNISLDECVVMPNHIHGII